MSEDKNPDRIHYLNEWMMVRGYKKPKKRGSEEMILDVKRFLGVLNADPELLDIDKSQVHRWLKGQNPQTPMLIRLARALELFDPISGEPDPHALYRKPEHNWIATRLAGKTPRQVERIQRIVDEAIDLTEDDPPPRPLRVPHH